jgi:hypothetical protein
MVTESALVAAGGGWGPGHGMAWHGEWHHQVWSFFHALERDSGDDSNKQHWAAHLNILWYVN